MEHCCACAEKDRAVQKELALVDAASAVLGMDPESIQDTEKSMLDAARKFLQKQFDVFALPRALS